MIRRPLSFRGLYGIAGPTVGQNPQAETLTLAEALLAGGVPILQLRDKKSDGRSLLETARILRQRTRDLKVCFIVNDRLDIALMAEADGVHVGQDDLPVGEVRRVAARVGREGLLVGLSTHDLAQVREAKALAPDYIGFGPVFGTTTKADALTPRGVGLLAEAVAVADGLPVVAIGGIALPNLPEVVRTRVAMAAVIGDIASHPVPRDRAGEIHRALSGALP